MPLVLGLVLALIGGGGGFYSTYFMGVLSDHSVEEAKSKKTDLDQLPKTAFVAIEPIVVSLGQTSNKQHLRFQAQLDIPPESRVNVEQALPRILDAINVYLNAIDIEDLERSSALIEIKYHLLRRVQLVVGPAHINDLLIMEFVVT